MALLTKTGTITAKTGSTGSVSYTGIGFQPKALILFNENPQPSGTQAGLLMGFASGSSNQLSSTHYDENGPTTSNTGCGVRSQIFSTCNAAGTVQDSASLTSFDADGFTLNWSNTAASAYNINYIAIGGSEVAAYVGDSQGRSSTGNLAISAPGFTPDALIVVGTGRTAINGTTSHHARTSVGFATPAAQYVASCASDDNVGTSVTGGFQSSGYVQWIHQGHQPTLRRYSVSSWDANGFTLNCDTSSGSTDGRFMYLVLKGVRANIVAKPPRTTTGSDTSDLGYDANLALVTSSDFPTSSSAEMSFGVADGTNNLGVWMGSANGQANMVARSATSSSYAFIDYTPSTGAVEIANSISTSPGRITYTYDNVVGTSFKSAYYLLLGTLYQVTALGGLTLSGAAPAKVKLKHQPTGGMVLGGSAGLIIKPKFSTSGGLVLSGTSPAVVKIAHQGGGGIEIGGQASSAVVKLPHQSTGGIEISGHADSSYQEAGDTEYQYSASGGLTIGGGANLRLAFTLPTEGGIAISGESSARVSLSHQSAGGIALEGQSGLTVGIRFGGEGGIEIGGTSSADVKLSHQGQGAIEIGGQAESSSEAAPQDEYWYQASGGMVLGGEASPRIHLSHTAGGQLVITGAASTRIGKRNATADALIVTPRYTGSILIGPAFSSQVVRVEPRYNGQVELATRYQGAIKTEPKYTTQG